MSIEEADVAEPLELSRDHQILCVDDDPGVLAALWRLFRREPYEVVTMERPEQALEVLGVADFSLVLVDQRMPRMYGTELAERARRLSPNTIRVMLTAYPGSALIRHGMARDVQWLVSKPWNDDSLRVTIRSLLHELETRMPPPPEYGNMEVGR